MQLTYHIGNMLRKLMTIELIELYIEMYMYIVKKLCLKNLKEHYALYVDNAI